MALSMVAVGIVHSGSGSGSGSFTRSPRVVLWFGIQDIVYLSFLPFPLSLLPLYLRSLSSGFDSIDCPCIDSECSSGEFRSWTRDAEIRYSCRLLNTMTTDRTPGYDERRRDECV